MKLFKKPDHGDTLARFAWDSAWLDFWSTRNLFGKCILLPALVLICTATGLLMLTYKTNREVE